MSEKIFDIHTHVYPPALAPKASAALGKFYDFVPQGEGTAEELCRDGGTYRRDGFLLLAVATNPGQVTKVNEYAALAAEGARGEGKQAFFFAGIHQDTEDIPGALEHARSLGAAGVKIHPDIQGAAIDDRRFYPVYRWLSENGLPLCLHMGDDRAEYPFSKPEKLKKILSDFPRLRVLASHLGGYRAQIEAQEYLQGLPNILYDTSSSLWYLAPQAVRDFLSRVGTEQVMFGTDYPVRLIDDEMRYFDRLGLSAEVREKILYQNAAAFLQI